MDDIQATVVKTATAEEIGNLASCLCPKDQAYVLNTINTLLFRRQAESMPQQQTEVQKTSEKVKSK